MSGVSFLDKSDHEFLSLVDVETDMAGLSEQQRIKGVDRFRWTTIGRCISRGSIRKGCT